MNSLLIFITSGLQITLLDIVLSGDNVGVIALAVRRLDKKQAKLASIIGITGAIALRIFFASIVTIIMTVEWLPIKLVGGLLLLVITWNLIKDDNGGEEGEESKIKAGNSFMMAVGSIILADASMSLDNVLAIGGTANGHVGLIVFGIALNIPIIFFGSQLVANLMERYKIIVYLGGAVLIRTATAMIIDDRLINGHVNHNLAVILPWACAVAVMVYGTIKCFGKKSGSTKKLTE